MNEFYIHLYVYASLDSIRNKVYATKRHQSVCLSNELRWEGNEVKGFRKTNGEIWISLAALCFMSHTGYSVNECVNNLFLHYNSINKMHNELNHKYYNAHDEPYVIILYIYMCVLIYIVNIDLIFIIKIHLQSN